MIAILDYGAGNLKSVEKAFAFLGEAASVTKSPEVAQKAESLILPGVGAFGEAAKKLAASGLTNVILEAAKSKKPLLGICLGMQLLFEESDESPGVAGLGLFAGKVRHFGSATEKFSLKIPHMGWNSLCVNPKSRLFAGLNNPYVYFVHSFFVDAKNQEDVAATSEYEIPFCAAAERDNLFCCQFHPEKSGEAGLAILKNFAAISNGKQ